MTSNAIPPSVTYPSPNEWPQDLIKSISNITRDSHAKITSTGHGFTSASENITFVSFKQVKGMIQINGLDALIIQILDADNFLVNIDSTNFFNYVSNGIVIVDSGLPPTQQSSFQTFNTPFQNIAN